MKDESKADVSTTRSTAAASENVQDDAPALLSFDEMLKKYEYEIVKNLLKNGEKRLETDEDFEQHAKQLLMMSEDETRKILVSVRASISNGNVTSDSIGRSLLKLLVCLKRKRSTPNLNDRTKKILDQHILDVYKLQFLHMDNLEGNQNKAYCEDLVKLMYEMCEGDETSKPTADQL